VRKLRQDLKKSGGYTETVTKPLFFEIVYVANYFLFLRSFMFIGKAFPIVSTFMNILGLCNLDYENGDGL